MKLSWKNIVCDRGAYSLEIVMQKTKDSDVKVTQVYAKIVIQKKNDAVNLVNSVFA